jgi:SagB-type dehydrogenase family enzyme
VLYWETGSLFLENFLAGTRSEANPVLVSFLDACATFSTPMEIMAKFPHVAMIREVVQRLISAALLIAENSELELRDRAINEEWAWSMNARYFHFSTQRVEYTFDFPALTKFFEAKASILPPPSPFKKICGRRVPLGDGDLLKMSVFEALDQRRTCRNFDRNPISFGSFCSLTSVTWGMTRYYNDSVLDRRIIKRSPSGGARHPIEVYPIVLRVDGLEPGPYHYDVELNAITRIGGEISEEKLEDLFSGQYWIRNAAVAFIMTAVLPRSMWKYDHSRAYRVVQLDAGHLGQTLHIVATALGLGVFTTAALQDRVIESTLGIDGITETVVYAGAVGVAALARDNQQREKGLTRSGASRRRVSRVPASP